MQEPEIKPFLIRLAIPEDESEANKDLALLEEMHTTLEGDSAPNQAVMTATEE